MPDNQQPETFAVMNTAREYEIQMYPHICDVATRMALDNGCINRAEPVERFYQTCDEVIADRDAVDLAKLDIWIQCLTQEQRDILADGEETERNSLVGSSPRGGDDMALLANLFDDIFEVM